MNRFGGYRGGPLGTLNRKLHCRTVHQAPPSILNFETIDPSCGQRIGFALLSTLPEGPRLAVGADGAGLFSQSGRLRRF